MYVELQFDEFVCPVGNAGNPAHAEEYKYNPSPSNWINCDAVLPHVFDSVWYRIYVVVAGTTTVCDPVSHVILLGTGPDTAGRLKMNDPVSTTPFAAFRK